MPALTPEDRSRISRIGGLVRSATYDGATVTAKARQAAEDRFAKQVDPDGTLTPTERARRAEAAKRAWFTQLARKSAEARRTKASA